MTEIPGLKNDVAFLKKFDSRINAWIDMDEKDKPKCKEKVRSNFLLHPKRLGSDSECSSALDSSPRKFFSMTVIKSTSLDEPNNNITKRDSFIVSCAESKIINDDAELYLDSCPVEKAKSCKTQQKFKSAMPVAGNSHINVVSPTRKHSKPRPNSSYGRLESFEKKFAGLVERTVKILNNIRQTVEKGIGPPDGEEDLARRLKRLQEFSARFSRNYLYPLLRQVGELNTPERLSSVALNQKMLYAQQIILNGLQAYYNYLPSSVGKCCSDKLKSLLEQIVSLSHVYAVLKEKKTETSECVNIMRSQAELLIEAVEAFNLKLIEKNRKVNESKAAPNKKKMKSQHDKKKSKLSMYAVSASFRKDLEWKKTVEALAKKKFNVKSRYKTSNFKHRPPVEKPHIINLPISKVKLFPKRSSTSLKTTPMKSPIREDDIKTMVEMESELTAPPNSGELLNHENNVASGERLVRDSDRAIEVEDNNVKRALEVLKKFLGESMQDQAQFLKKIASEVEKKQQEPENMVEEQAKKKLKEPIVTVTGAKNAKLICIRDDNSVIESGDEEKKDKEIMTDAEIKMSSSETQTDLKLDQNLVSKSTIKISRLPKTNRKLLTLLPKQYAINIIQYKLRYAHFHKHNAMYRKSANVQPWVLMGRISDDILDYVLRSVTSELEVNEILEDLYNAEFQY